MTLPEWVAKYNKKAVEPYAPLPSDCLFFDPDKGFLVLRHESSQVLWLYAACGDGTYWNEIARGVAKKAGYKTLRAITIHPPRFWQAKGWKLHSYTVEKEV